MLVALAACQKENKGVTSAPKVKLTAKHDASLPPAYTDLTLMSDGSYEGVWNACGIRVTNPAWDQVKYPSLVNGVPVTAESMTTYDGSSSIDAANTGTSGNVFQVSKIIGSLVYTAFNSTDFHSGISNYSAAVKAWISGGQHGAVPDISTYILDTYTKTVGTDMVKTYTGKLIRVATGSHLAIATLSYALPSANSVNPDAMSVSIYDPADPQYPYSVHSSYHVITSATKANINYNATGTMVPGSGGVIAVTGTIIRADGTTFEFNTTIAP